MHTGQRVPLQLLNYLWANTAGDFHLRRFLADMCTRTLSPDHFDVNSKFSGKPGCFIVFPRAYAVGYEKSRFSRNGPELIIANYYVPESGEKSSNKSLRDGISHMSSVPVTRSARSLSAGRTI